MVCPKPPKAGLVAFEAPNTDVLFPNKLPLVPAAVFPREPKPENPVVAGVGVLPKPPNAGADVVAGLLNKLLCPKAGKADEVAVVAGCDPNKPETSPVSKYKFGYMPMFDILHKSRGINSTLLFLSYNYQLKEPY